MCFLLRVSSSLIVYPYPLNKVWTALLAREMLFENLWRNSNQQIQNVYLQHFYGCFSSVLIVILPKSNWFRRVQLWNNLDIGVLVLTCNICLYRKVLQYFGAETAGELPRTVTIIALALDKIKMLKPWQSSCSLPRLPARYNTFEKSLYSYRININNLYLWWVTNLKLEHQSQRIKCTVHFVYVHYKLKYSKDNTKR